MLELFYIIALCSHNTILHSWCPSCVSSFYLFIMPFMTNIIPDTIINIILFDHHYSVIEKCAFRISSNFRSRVRHVCFSRGLLPFAVSLCPSSCWHRPDHLFWRHLRLSSRPSIVAARVISCQRFQVTYSPLCAISCALNNAWKGYCIIFVGHLFSN